MISFHRLSPLFVAVLVAMAACGDTATTHPVGTRELARATALISEGVEQHVVVTEAPPHIREHADAAIRSTLVNRSAEARTIEARICGLDTQGDLVYEVLLPSCAGFSRTYVLQPGDSAVSEMAIRLPSQPGTYELRVRHALNPDHWAALAVIVQ